MLRGASGGYTIIELMIVLAVSSILLASAALTIQGATGRTQFSESMRDINSKLISWMSNVNNGFPGTSNGNYNCTTSGGRPAVSAGGPSQTPDCIYLGKVIQFTTSSDVGCPSGCDPSKIYAYSLFGQRTDANGSLISNLTDANPEPAVPPNSVDLTETYTIPGGTTIKSISANLSTASGQQTRLLGFTQSFNATALAANGSQDIFLYSDLTSDSPPANKTGSPALQCMELLNPGPCQMPNTQTKYTWPPVVKTWTACFASGYDSETAQITISANDNGLGPQTKMEITACS